ncbi:hypothetical protein L484_027534 [Morus notabilis]|uniref:Uncharacterized protein n=1 Tax=Morus notabilis TaxID=981085 RepID=W9S698_9ROSA|nr:hypothetical protein L484_027534 [Morus notabilis]
MLLPATSAPLPSGTSVYSPPARLTTPPSPNDSLAADIRNPMTSSHIKTQWVPPSNLTRKYRHKPHPKSVNCDPPLSRPPVVSRESYDKVTTMVGSYPTRHLIAGDPLPSRYRIVGTGGARRIRSCEDQCAYRGSLLIDRQIWAMEIALVPKELTLAAMATAWWIGLDGQLQGILGILNF